MYDNLVAGLISGLLVTLFVVVFRSVWKDTLVPWIENRVYKDVRIEGTWFSLYPTEMSYRQETISLTRHGHAVTGTIICNKGPDEGEKYKVSGSFRNLILALIYESHDKQKVDRGTLTFKCVQNGHRLVGKIAIYHDRTDSIRDQEVIWFRNRSDLEEVLNSVKERREDIDELPEKEAPIDQGLREISDKKELDSTEDKKSS